MINEDIILKAKQSNLPDLFRNANIELIPTNNGSSFKCKCPFHEDHEPSLNLNNKNGIWLFNCFGCGTGGTSIDFIMKFENKDFKSAVLSVAGEKDSGIARIDFKKLNAQSLKLEVQEEGAAETKATRKELLSMLTDHYHKNLMNGENKGKAYLQKRGLWDEGIIKTFKLGYSNNGANEALREYRQQLREELGIFKVNYWETFANSVVFPVLDLEGNPTDLYARRVMNYTDRANHCYNKGKHQGIFNILNVKDAETIILTEGIIDALSICKAGFKNVTALYGVNGLTEAHETIFKNGIVKKLILALDNDEAGKTGIKRIAKELQGLEICSVQLPEGIKDVNELLLNQGIEAVQKAINESVILKVEAQGIAPESSEESLAEKHIREALEAERNETQKDGCKIRYAEIEDGAIRKKEITDPQEVDELFNFPHFNFNGTDLVFRSSVLTYTIRDVARLKSLASLRFVITAKKNEEAGEVLPVTDRIDLYLLRSRSIFEKKVADVFNIQPAVIEKDFASLITFIESDFKRRKSGDQKDKDEGYKMTAAEEKEALQFLKTPNLIRNIIDDLTSLGYVGEDDNKLLLYLGATSRKLSKPISILIRSQSSTGKSFLISIICELMPPEDVHKWTSLTPKALYYMAPDALKHKFIAIDERAGMEEAEYPIRSLQSGGTLSLAVPIKNPTNGQITTEQIVKEGPIAYVDGSTDTRVNPENANRCFEMFLDESAGQTRLVQRQQKKAHSLEAMNSEENTEAVKRRHQNAQRLLKPVKVVIPFIDLIEFPSDWIRMRRDHDRFLSLIVCITFLHQYQRERKEMNGKPYIEATLKDYAIAYKVAKTVLFNTFQELEKPLFDFYLQLNDMVERNAKEQNVEPEEFMFTRRMVRQSIKLPDYLVKRYMRILKDLEYFEVKSNGNGSRDAYRLIVQARKTDHLSGLTTSSQLKAKMEVKKSPLANEGVK